MKSQKNILPGTWFPNSPILTSNLVSPPLSASKSRMFSLYTSNMDTVMTSDHSTDLSLAYYYWSIKLYDYIEDILSL